MNTSELTSSADLALARAVVYRFLSDALRHPGRSTLVRVDWVDALRAALDECGEPQLIPAAEACIRLGLDRPSVESAYGRLVGHTPRAGIPPYESEWLGAAGDLLQYHQMADVSAFYSAFGLRLTEGCDERVDHVGIELAFLQFLCAKEAWAVQAEESSLAGTCRDAQGRFLSEHVARWTPAFFHRVRTCSGSGHYQSLAEFAGDWIAAECRRLELPCGDPTLAPGESSVTLEDTCVSCAHASSCVPGGALPNDAP